jgi:hypothetical protein
MPPNREIMKAARTLINGNADVSKAVVAMRKRGLSQSAAEEEVAMCMLGCTWEASYRMPNRFQSVFQGLQEGKSAKDLFHDELYTPQGPANH